MNGFICIRILTGCTFRKQCVPGTALFLSWAAHGGSGIQYSSGMKLYRVPGKSIFVSEIVGWQYKNICFIFKELWASKAAAET